MCAQADARTRTKVNRTRGDEMIPTDAMRGTNIRIHKIYTRTRARVRARAEGAQISGSIIHARAPASTVISL